MCSSDLYDFVHTLFQFYALNKCVVISCCFICNFPQIFEVEHVFIFFISFLYFILFFWRAVYLDIFPIFNWVVCLLTVFVFCFGGVFFYLQSQESEPWNQRIQVSL